MSLPAALREYYVREFPGDAARVIEGRAELPEGLDELSVESVTRLLEHVDPGRLQSLFLSLDTQHRARVLQIASIRTAMLILRSLPEDELEATLDSLPRRVRAEYVELLEFPERTAGRYMDRLLARYRSDQTVGEALT